MINERERLQLYEQLQQTLGPEPAGTLMELLPPTSWDDIATNEKVEAQGIQLRGEMAELRSDLRTEMAELRSDLRTEMAELRGEMAELRGEMAGIRGEMAGIRGDLTGVRGEIGLDLARHLRMQVAANMATMLTLTALIVGLT